MEINKTRYDKTLADSQAFSYDHCKKLVDEGRAKLMKASTQLVKTGNFAEVSEFNGSAAEKQEQMSNLNTDLTAWNEHLGNLQANIEWAKRQSEHAETQTDSATGEQKPVRPSPEQLQNGLHIGVEDSCFRRVSNKLFKQLAKLEKESADVGVKDLLMQLKGVQFEADFAFADGNVGESISNVSFGTTSWTPESRRSGLMAELPRHVPILPNLLPVVRWGQAAYPYVKETKALIAGGSSDPDKFRGDAYRDEGTSGPEAELAVDVVTEPITSMSYYLNVHQEVLEDVPGARGYVNQRMPMLGDDILNDRLLNGQRAQNATKGVVGFLNRPNLLTMAAADNTLGANSTDALLVDFIDDIQDAMMENVVKGAAYPDFCLFNPKVFAMLRKVKDKQGRYYFGDPSTVGIRSLWGVPFSWHPTMPVIANDAKVGLMGAFRSHSAYIARKGMTLAFSDSHDKNFTALVGTFRVDLRHGLAVYRDAAFTIISAGATA